MGNLITAVANSFVQEMAKKVGLDSYNIDFEHNFTIDGIFNNPKCKFVTKNSTIRADNLFAVENIGFEDAGRICVLLKIPKISILIGKGSFSCSDPKFSCDASGCIQIVDTYFSVTLSATMGDGWKIDFFNITSKITEIKSAIKLLVNNKDYSDLANSMLHTKDPAFLNFILEHVLKSLEESIKQFLEKQSAGAGFSTDFD